MKPKLLFVLGTRPEIIKLWPVIVEAQKSLGEGSVRVCYTGQHKEMALPFLERFSLPVHFDLRIMRSRQTLNQVLELMISGMAPILRKESFDWVVVQGDTSSAFAGALAASMEKVKVAHVEAGLRTFDRENPFPEELNRQLIGRVANLHLCPTSVNRDHLLKEGVSEADIEVTGNPIVDALKMVKAEFLGDVDVERTFSQLDFSKKLVLVTGHRRENFGEGFRDMCMAIRDLAERRKDAIFVYPVHLNPQVQEPVKNILGDLPNHVFLLDPVEYFDFIALLQRASVVLTDSGGVQEEAPTFGVPVVVMRKVTERVESLQQGSAVLVGTDREKIVSAVEKFLDEPKEISNLANPYGDGLASKRILEAMLKR